MEKIGLRLLLVPALWLLAERGPARVKEGGRMRAFASEGECRGWGVRETVSGVGGEGNGEVGTPVGEGD